MRTDQEQVAALREAADSADRDAAGEWPGSYYRKAHKARARRLRAKATRLERALQQARKDQA